MKRFWKHVRAEWEIALCGVAVIALSCSLLAGWLRMHAAEPDRASRKQAPREASLLAPDACAFLEPSPEPSEEPPSPFVFEGQTKAPRQPPPKNRPPVVVAPEPVAPPAPEPPPVVAAPAPEPVPAERPVLRQRVYGVRFVTYLYNVRNASGRPMAAVQVHDPVTNQTAPPAMLPIGGATDDIRIVSFDEQNLVVLDARGKRHQIPFGKSARVSSTPHLVEVRQ